MSVTIEASVIKNVNYAACQCGADSCLRKPSSLLAPHRLPAGYASGERPRGSSLCPLAFSAVEARIGRRGGPVLSETRRQRYPQEGRAPWVGRMNVLPRGYHP